MKVDNLLGPYLYQHKKLSLPGIGLFTLDDKAVLPDENAKVKMAIEGISFNPKTGQQLDDSLIQYIKEQTGKMKALAEADLYSFIATAFQYLNIGKPFHFEGIGTLQKTKDNTYTFTAGTMIQQKADEVSHKHVETKRKQAYNNEDAVGGSSANTGKIVILLIILATLGLIGWGGYYLYNKNTGDETPVAQSDSKPVLTVDTTTTVTDSTTTPDSLARSMKPADSNIAATTPAAVSNTAGYKFILETTDKKIRAAKRYEQLKGVTLLPAYGNKVAVETKDSLTFKIYTMVPCPVTDTAKVKEQLNAWYYGTATMKVKIEQ